MGSQLRSFRRVVFLFAIVVVSLLLTDTPFEAQGSAPPLQATLVAPTGAVSMRRPALTWNAQPGVVYYLAQVVERTGTTNNWVTAEDAGCSAGTGTCTTTLEHDLDLGQVRWQALAWNGYAYGPWSSTQEFIVSAMDPAAPEVAALSPAGQIADEWLPFRWTRVPDAVWYRLWRRDGAGIEFERWIRPSEAGCVTAGPCQVTITPYLPNGNGSWKVQAWTLAGSGPWSAEQSFAVTLAAPAPPQPAAPSGTVSDRRPTFSWPATPHSWNYLLRVWVGSTYMDRWYTPNAAGCAPGISTACSVRPDPTLPFGPVSWQLIAWNRSGYSEWSGRLNFVVTDPIPPTITATFSPMPDAGGWNGGNVTATFTCADESGIAVCTPPLQITGEGDDLPVTGTATDVAGNTLSNTWHLKIDRSAPVVHVFYPGEGSRVPAATRSVTIRGGAYDLSGLGSVSCAGVTAAVNGSLFSCTVNVAPGFNAVSIEAHDTTGHTTIAGVTFLAADTPLSSVEISPGSMTMFVGDSREIYVKDQDGNGVDQATWTVTDTSVARVSQSSGVTTVTAVGPGTATLDVAKGAYIAHATVTVYASDSVLPAGTTLWSLNDSSSWGAPKRGEVLRAASTTPDPESDPASAPALMFVDEGSEWSAGSLARFNERPTRIRTTTADGRELSNVAFAGRLPQQIAADSAGGFIVVLPASGGQPSALQRFDGPTGLMQWEYVPTGGFLTDAAVHPDGTIYLSEFHIAGTSYLVGVTPGGGYRKWSLPRGSFKQKDTGTCGLNQDVTTPANASPPIIREDGAVILLTHESSTFRPIVSSRDEQGNCRTQGSVTYSLAQTAHVVTLTAEGGLTVTSLNTSVSDIPTQTLDQKALLPDGHDGLLLVDRKTPWAMHISPGSGSPAPTDYRVSAANFAILPADGSTRYEAEYVLGEDGVYAVINSFRRTPAYRYYSKAVQFDPITLQAISTTDLGIPMPAPQHIRLKFALAGGGVYLSAPSTAYVVNPQVDTSGFAAGGNASQITQSDWTGWNPTAALAVGAPANIANTPWARTLGNDAGANAADQEKVGIMVKSQSEVFIGRHTSIRFAPHHQDRWINDPTYGDRFRYYDTETGLYFATLGAGPTETADTASDCSGKLKLVSNINRPNDVGQSYERLEKLRYNVLQEDELIERLLTLGERNYRDELNYCFFPTADGFYNSNSFISGLLKAGSIAPPLFPTAGWSPLPLYPGWAKPVPALEFATR